MKGSIVITLSLVAVAKCRPDVSLSIPSGSYLPSDQGTFNYSNFGCHGHSYLPPSGSYDQVEDKKHVHFYAGSEGLYSKFKINIQPANQKQTKIIFVKAPGHKIVPKVISPPSNVEDKTLVYVLVKKPQDQSISIPTGLGIKQTKPEVFFIKYNNKHDAASQVSAGTQGQSVGSIVPDLGSQVAFVGTLGNGHRVDAGSYLPPSSSGPY